jgi:hypothetical protein
LKGEIMIAMQVSGLPCLFLGMIHTAPALINHKSDNIGKSNSNSTQGRILHLNQIILARLLTEDIPERSFLDGALKGGFSRPVSIFLAPGTKLTYPAYLGVQTYYISP